jgi:predicted patatin/cPLA2 family phospholipase
MNYSEADGKASHFKQLICKMPGRVPRLMAEHDRLKRKAKRFLRQNHEDLSLTVIQPRQSISIGRFTSDGEKLQSCIDAGYSDGLEFIRSGQII